MSRLEKTRVYVIVLGVASLIFSVVNPSLNVPILVAFAWYAYVWKKEYEGAHHLPGFLVYCIAGSIGCTVVIIRTVLFNI